MKTAHRVWICFGLGLTALSACATQPPAGSPNTQVSVEAPEDADRQRVTVPRRGEASSAAKGETTLELAPIADDLPARLAHFQPVPIGVDEARLDPKTRQLIRKLIEAGQRMQEVFLEQVDPKNPLLRLRLLSDRRFHDALLYFDLMGGPWDRTDPHQAPFIGTRPKPPQGDFYPQDLTKADVEAWLAAHPGDKEGFQSYFTVIRRGAGGLVVVPYSEAYKVQLEPAAASLREAAQLASDPRLKTFLEKRAAAFLSNDYVDSDMAWMDLGDAPLEVTIGPYEVYDDELMGWKASFEAYIGLRDTEESARLEMIAKYLPRIDEHLPLDAAYRGRSHRGAASPISVIQLLYSAGQPGVHPTAYNLPNDERVRKAKGSKKVMLKNIAEAKFKAQLTPIADRMLVEGQKRLVSFDAFFTFVLMHEMSHGLGPATVETPRGEEEVSKALEELYGPIEEAKADICGVVATQWLIDHSVLPAALERPIYASYLGGVFRTVRFGATEAHARGELASFNFIAAKGGVSYDRKARRYRVDFEKIKPAMRALAHEYLTMEALGDRGRAKSFLAKYAVMSPEMESAVATLKDLPVDIRPEFTVLSKLRGW
jgi:hypothetical protein